VASEAIVEDLLRLQLRERNDCCLAASSLDVSLPGAVTPFASGAFRGLIAEGNALVMRVPEKRCGDIRVATLADLAAHVSRGIRLRLLRGSGREENRQEQECGRRCG
jgi:hypothetical protein